MGLLERRSQLIARFAPEEGEALHRFQQELFGPRARQLDEARRRWLFVSNPLKVEPEASLWIATHEGEVVGQQAGISHRLKVGDLELSSSWSVDLMVRPEWRLRGIGPALTDTYRRSYDLVMAVGATEAAYRAVIRSGWVGLGSLPTFVRPYRLNKILAWRGREGGLLGAAAHLATPGIKLLDTINSTYAFGSGTRLVEIPRFDARADAIWRTSSPDYPIAARRDLAFLGWRFDDSVDAGLYHRFYLMRGETVLGYAVLRSGEQLGVEVGFVVDYLCPIAWSGPLFAWCVDWFRGREVEALVADLNSPRAEPTLSRLGFWKGQRASGKRLLFSLGATCPASTELLNDPAAWFVTRADSDWDHPD